MYHPHQSWDPLDTTQNPKRAAAKANSDHRLYLDFYSFLFQRSVNINMPASNGGRSGGKNKKKDGDLMENVSFSCHFPLEKTRTCSVDRRIVSP